MSLDALTLARVLPHAETPFYWLDLEAIRDRFLFFANSWSQCFPTVIFGYSFKTNPLACITNSLRKLGCHAEVISGVELRWALDDGFTGEAIIYNGPWKRDSELSLAVSAGCLIHVDSNEQLERTLSISQTMSVRARLGLRLSHRLPTGEQSRFGLTEPDLDSALKSIANSGSRLEGVQFHVGSNLADADLYVKVLHRYSNFIRECAGLYGAGFRIDIGGGFAADSLTTVHTFAQLVREGMESLGLSPGAFTLILEPGRVLVEDAAFLIVSVIARKRGKDGKQTLLVDGGTNLVSSSPRRLHGIEGLVRKKVGETGNFVVSGPMCYEPDILALGAVLPADTRAGNRLVIRDVGAIVV